MTICGHLMKVEGRLIRLARIDGEQFTVVDDPGALLHGLRQYRADLFTFLQSPPDTAPKYSYPMEWDNFAVLPVSTFENWWTQQIRSEVRTKARKAEKNGVVFREVPFDDTLLRGICEIYNETPIRQGRRFPHYGMTLEGARSYAGTYLDRSIFIGAFLDGRMVGFVKLIINQAASIACAIHLISFLCHADKAPTNALVARAVEACAKRGISFIVYGNFHYGNKSGDGLTHFKEVNGFRRMDLPRYYIPLTPLGRVALRLGLHRRFADYCPELIGMKVRDLRGWWLRRSFSGISQKPVSET